MSLAFAQLEAHAGDRLHLAGAAPEQASLQRKVLGQTPHAQQRLCRAPEIGNLFQYFRHGRA
jgi:hypothetical protein